MTEFGSVQEITDKINVAEGNLATLRKARAKAKRNSANSTELKDKKNVLAGLKQLQSSNNKAFSDVSSDEDRQKLVDRARDLNLEIATVEKEIGDFSKVVEDFDKQVKVLVKEIENLEKQRNIVSLKSDLDKSLSEASSIDDALGSVEAVLNQAFNYRGVFEGEDFVNNTFAQESIKRVLSEKFNEKQVEALMSVAARRAVSFISAYADNDDVFDMTVGAYFSTLRAQIEIVEDFAS